MIQLQDFCKLVDAPCASVRVHGGLFLHLGRHVHRLGLSDHTIRKSTCVGFALLVGVRENVIIFEVPVGHIELNPWQSRLPWLNSLASA
jgi:hypothetical protein